VREEKFVLYCNFVIKLLFILEIGPDLTNRSIILICSKKGTDPSLIQVLFDPTQRDFFWPEETKIEKFVIVRENFPKPNHKDHFYAINDLYKKKTCFLWNSHCYTFNLSNFLTLKNDALKPDLIKVLVWDSTPNSENIRCLIATKKCKKWSGQKIALKLKF